MKKLIINADDFGMSHKNNRVILNLIKDAIITSTTVMIDKVDEGQKGDLQELLQLEKEKDIGIGLHVEFTNDSNFENDIKKQFYKFVEVFRQKPSHLDMHKPTYKENGYPVIMKFCIEQNLPFRNWDFVKLGGVTTTREMFSGTGTWLDEIYNYVTKIKDGESAEILFHPGEYDKDSSSSLNREREIDVIKARYVTQYAKDLNIELINFKNL